MRIISRRDALAAGLKRYFTGKPCKNGHVAERHVSGGGCVVCAVERSQKPEVKERWREYTRKPETKARKREYQRAYHQRPEVKARAYHQRPEIKERARAYEQKPEIKARRRERRHSRHGTIPIRPMPEFCECRGCIPGKKGLVIEHCHKTNKFRGWVCNNCNTGIGMLGDTVEGLMHAVEYLRRAGEG